MTRIEIQIFSCRIYDDINLEKELNVYKYLT